MNIHNFFLFVFFSRFNMLTHLYRVRVLDVTRPPSWEGMPKQTKVAMHCPTENAHGSFLFYCVFEYLPNMVDGVRKNSTSSLGTYYYLEIIALKFKTSKSLQFYPKPTHMVAQSNGFPGSIAPSAPIQGAAGIDFVLIHFSSSDLPFIEYWFDRKLIWSH